MIGAFISGETPDRANGLGQCIVSLFGSRLVHSASIVESCLCFEQNVDS